MTTTTTTARKTEQGLVGCTDGYEDDRSTAREHRSLP